MRLYNQQHRFYCGVDLHARSMFTHILDNKGKTVFERDLPAGPEHFLDAVKPFQKQLVVGAECMFAWYWLADLCEDHTIPFVLGHALYMKMIHGGKAKTVSATACFIIACPGFIRGSKGTCRAQEALLPADRGVRVKSLSIASLISSPSQTAGVSTTLRLPPCVLACRPH